MIHQLNVNADYKREGLDYTISVADAGHKGFQLYQSSVYGKLADNKLSTTLMLKDKKVKSRYVLSGHFHR